MKRHVLLTLVLITLCGICIGQETKTGRQYYEELLAASGLNPLMTSVCFPEDQADVFLVIGFTKHFSETAKSKGVQLKPGHAKMFSSQDSLMVEAYKRGVPAQTLLLAHDTLEPDTWRDEYDFRGALQTHSQSVP